MKKVVFSVFILLFSLLFANEPKVGGVLVFGRASDSSALDPAIVSDKESYHASDSIYDNLVQFKYGTTKLEPALATSWDISKDGLEYVFHLRKGVYFHTTKFFKKKSEFTSKDVVFSFKRQMDKTHPYHKVGGTFEYWNAMDMSNIVKDVVALDKYTVKITLKRNEAPFLANLAMQFASILSSDYAQALAKKGKEKDISKKPIGTGPFVFKKWLKDDKIILSANKKYWAGRPYLNKLILKVIPNQSVRAAELKTKGIHIFYDPIPAEIPILEKDKNLKVEKQEVLNIRYLAFNTEKKPFDNVLVRQAISYAINLDALVDAVYEGNARKADNPIPPTLWSYNKDVKPYEFNVQKAKELLTKAGYPNGFETKLWTMQRSNGRKIAEVIQGDLAKIGIKAKIVSYDWGTYVKNVTNGEHDMCIFGWGGDNGDPDNFLYPLLSKHAAMQKPSQNVAFWKNDEFSNLVTKAKSISDEKERTKLYVKAQEVFGKEAPWKPIAYFFDVYPMLKEVQGFKIDPVKAVRFHKVWLDK